MNWEPMPQQQNQAFDQDRVSVNEHGKTGAAIEFTYDGTGSAAEGGDALATIVADGFFSSRAMQDLCTQAAWDEKTQKVRVGNGVGATGLIRANDAIAIRVFWNDSGTVKALAVANQVIPR